MSRKILIVEDEFVVANDLQLILENAGYTIPGIATSFSEAQESIQSQKPDLVLLDIRLNGKMSGIDIARKLRAGHIPFIYLSAYANQTILEEAKTTEPYGFLVKPFRKKDLLVALEIAWYLHQHSLESKLRHEEQMKKSLGDISNVSPDASQSLFQVAGIIQPHIPFDFIACGVRPMDTKQFTDTGYVRTGFDEYQLIGEKEFRTMAGLTKKTLTELIENSMSDDRPVIYRDGIRQNTGNNLLLRKWMDCLRMQSCLVFPVALGYGLSVHYFFYSRQQDIYHKEHMALLNRLKVQLEDLANKTVYAETSSGHYVQNALPVLREEERRSADQGVFKDIIGNHHLLLSALDLAAQAAPYNTSVLILGESGTGKERVAQSIHLLSPVNKGPFIKVNCAAIPATLIESELFGHEKGAFTGATEKRKGKFELADGGTIFLDEIGELPLASQVKLLRVLQERQIEYVGGITPVKVNVRIVAATSRNLEKEVADRNFRLDLYYRLNVFPITLPPLRERKTDIEALAHYFAKRFCQEANKNFNEFSASMVEEMMKYDWPGNIRELENVVEQAVILNDGKSRLELRRILIPGSAVASPAMMRIPGDLKQAQTETEREYIVAALKKTNGKIRGTNGAAEILKIKPTTLESKMARLHISKEDFTAGFE